MKLTLHKAWQHVLITGICSVAFGIIALTWPSIPLYTFAWLFGAVIIVQGVFIVTGALRTRDEESGSWLLLLYGLLYIITGVIAAIFPGLTTIVLGFIISINLVIGGIIQLMMAIYLRKEMRGEGWVILSGLVTLGVGLYLLMVPGGGAMAMLWLIAIAAILIGIFFIVLAFKARSWYHEVQS